MRCTKKVLASALTALALTFGACGDSNTPPATDSGADQAIPLDSGPQPDATNLDVAVSDTSTKPDSKAPVYDATPLADISGTKKHEFVADQIVLPSNGTQAQLFGHDYDNDGNVDNALGSILGTLGLMGGMNVQGGVDESVNKGDLLLLFRFFANNVNNQNAAVVNYVVGQSQACCTAPSNPTLCASQAKATCFNGTASFTSTVTGAPMSGNIVSGKFLFGPGTVKLNLPVVGSALSLTLKQAFIKGTFTGATITSGSITGGIDQTELDGVILPAVATAVNGMILDPTTPASTKGTILALFDTNKDGKIDIGEIKNNVLVKSAIAPDVDVDGDGKLDLSLGIGYTAVGATIK